MRAVARRLAATLGLPDDPEVRSVAAVETVTAEPPLVVYSLSLSFTGSTAPARLWVPWRRVRGRLAPPGPAGSFPRLDAAVFSEAPVAVEVLLAGPVLTAGELLDLRPGDVVRLGSPQRDSLLRAGGVPIATARAGARASRLAVSILKIEGLREGSPHGS